MPAKQLLMFLLTAPLFTAGQDSLPSFHVRMNNNAVVVSWMNPRLDITELVIQRSLDSTKGFKSVMAMPDPTALSNGYVDKKIDAARYFYRIFYVLHGGNYVFTNAQRPREGFVDQTTAKPPQQQSDVFAPLLPTNSEDATGAFASPTYYRGPKAEMAVPDKIENRLPEDMFTPSALIYTNREGNLVLALPDTERKRYMLVVYLEQGSMLFRMRNIREPQLLVDRSNFFHSGWFRYDLYDGDKLREKGRFFIPPEIQ